MNPCVAPVLILDGGLGTSLEDGYGVRFDAGTPLWSSHLLVSAPGTLRDCQRDFGRVPVDILLTATYQTSVDAFARTTSPRFPNGICRSDIVEFLDLAVSIAEEAKCSAAKIALSLGPYGATMNPSQEYGGRYDAAHDSEEQLLCWHRDRLGIFCQIENLASRVDYVAFETVPRLDEIVAIRKLMAGLAQPSESKDQFRQIQNVPFWVSCVFPGEGYTLPDGSSVDEVVDALLSSEHSNNLPWGIGINCTKISKVPRLVQMYQSAVSRLVSAGLTSSWPSLILYPDGTNGEVYDTSTKTWKVTTHQENSASPWESQLAAIVDEARQHHNWRTIVVGGCCKASSNDIARLRAAVGGCT
ncbi:Homocysteine S-methyltransferase [Xylariaceae sp. FL0804]|nr:Homocysteine S-methyltransferase [Xylariaceae sp. FL0804]